MTSLPHYDKYGFNKEWLINAYYKVNYPNQIHNLDAYIIAKIDNLYKEYFNNYHLFINKLKELLPITVGDIKTYLEKEEKCLFCNDNYPFCFNSFLNVLDCSTQEDIIHKLCYDCIKKIQYCSLCQKAIDEPYSKIYCNYSLKDNIKYYHSSCYSCAYS